MRNIFFATTLLLAGQTLAQGVVHSQVNEGKLIIINKDNSVKMILSKPTGNPWHISANSINGEFTASTAEGLGLATPPVMDFSFDKLKYFLNYAVYFKSALENEDNLSEKAKKSLLINFFGMCKETSDGKKCRQVNFSTPECKASKENIAVCLKEKFELPSLSSNLHNLPENSGLGFVNRDWWAKGITSNSRFVTKVKYNDDTCVASMTDLEKVRRSDIRKAELQCGYVSTFKQIGKYFSQLTDEEFESTFATLMDLRNFENDKVNELPLLGLEKIRFEANKTRFDGGQTPESALALDTLMVADHKFNGLLPESISYEHTLTNYEIDTNKRLEIKESLDSLTPLKDGLTGLEIIRQTLKNLNVLDVLQKKVANIASFEGTRNNLLKSLLVDTSLETNKLSEDLSIKNNDLIKLSSPFKVKRTLKIEK